MSDANFVSRFTSEGADEVVADIENIADASEGIEGEHTVEVDAETEGATAELDDLAVLADELDGRSAEVSATVDTGTATDDLDAIVEALDDLDGETAEVEVEATADAAPIEDLAAALDDLDGSVATATVEVDSEGTSEQLETINEQLDRMANRVVRPTVAPNVDGVQPASAAVEGLAQTADVMAKAGLRGAAGMTKLAKATAASAVPIAGVVSAAKVSVDAFNELARAAARGAKATGMTTEEFSRWAAVAQDSGVETAKLQQSFSVLERNIAKGGSTLAAFGIATEDANGNLRSTSDVMLDIVGVLGSIDDPTQRAIAGTQLLGLGYKNLAPMIGATEEEMAAYLATVDESRVVTENEAAASKEMRTAQRELKQSLQDLKVAFGELVVELAPLVQLLADAVGAVGKVVGPVIDLGKKIGDLGDSARDAIKPNTELFDTIDEAGGPIRAAGHALVGLVKGEDDSAKAAEDAAAAFEDQAKAMLDSGKSTVETAQALSEMGASTEQVQVAMSKAGVSSEELADAQAQAADAAAEAAEAEQLIIDALNTEVEALNASIAANEAKSNAMRAAADANFAVVDAQASFNEELTKLPEALAAANGDLTKTIQVYGELAQSAAGVADAQVELAKEQAAASGQTLSATASLDIWNRSMLALAKQAGPQASAAIIDYVAQINQIPPETVTQIKAAIAVGDIAAAEKLLADVSRKRETTLGIDADTTQAETDAELLRQKEAGIPITMPTRADGSGATANMQTTAANAPTATIDTTADTGVALSQLNAVEVAPHEATITAEGETSPAEGDLSETADKKRTAKIQADADTGTAKSELDRVAEKRTAKFQADADTGTAKSELDNLSKKRTAPVDAYLREYPSNSDIQRKIGTVRVPVDAYTRSEPRITGVR